MVRKKDTSKKGAQTRTPADIETMDELEIPIKKENIEVMSLDNKPVNKEVTKEPINIPNKFVEIKTKKPISSNNKINTRNGRVYKDLGNGIGMYSDNGQTFII